MINGEDTVDLEKEMQTEVNESDMRDDGSSSGEIRDRSGNSPTNIPKF